MFCLPNNFYTSLNFTFITCRVEWMMDYLGMVCLAVNQVWWTWEVEDVFRKIKKGVKTALKDYAKKLHKQIDDLVVTVSGQGGDNRAIAFIEH